MSIDRGPRFKFRNLDEEDETLRIEEIRGLHFSYFRVFIVAPILVICTGLIYGLLLYWMPNLRANTFYTETSELRQATHILVRGISKYSSIFRRLKKLN